MTYKKKTDREKEDQSTTPQTDELLTVREVASHLRVDDTTVRRWAKAGALPVVILPHVNRRQAYRIRKSTLDALLNDPPVRRQAS